ncbi:hypothetical protein ACCT09_18490, partial [Rhizobium ruizarguesonis]
MRDRSKFSLIMRLISKSNNNQLLNDRQFRSLFHKLPEIKKGVDMDSDILVSRTRTATTAQG